MNATVTLMFLTCFIRCASLNELNLGCVEHRVVSLGGLLSAQPPGRREEEKAPLPQGSAEQEQLL